MFTIDQIKTAHSKVKSGADFPGYIREVKQLGVIGYNTYVTDGHTEYFGNDKYEIMSEPKYAFLTIAGKSDKEQFIKDLKVHQQGKTGYPVFCQDAARSGIEKWVVSLDTMTCTYYDKAGDEILVEQIPQ